MKKNCKFCGVEFEAKAHNAEYCSQSHRFKDYRKNNPRKKPLGNVQPMAFVTAPATARATATQRPMLDPLGDFMVRTVERERDKIDTELKELRKKYDSLKDKNQELEKQLENASRAMDEKPKGLMGFAQANPDMVSKALELGMPLLNTLAEKLMNNTPQQKQLAAPTDESGQPNPIWAWLVAQPKEVQEQFVMLIEKLEASQRLKDYLEAWNRQLMKVLPKQSAR